MMHDLYGASTAIELDYDEWHLPLVYTPGHNGLVAIDDESTPIEDLIRICVGRAARVSYLTHDGIRDTGADIRLHNSLITSGHMSPCEHAARPLSPDERVVRNRLEAVVMTASGMSDFQRRRLSEQIQFDGNFRGWHQYRKDLENEDDYSRILMSLNKI
jgi:hypothetical protein